jgi:hypothetical protein
MAMPVADTVPYHLDYLGFDDHGVVLDYPGIARRVR